MKHEVFILGRQRIDQKGKKGSGFDTGFFARGGGETIFLKKLWIFSDSKTDEFSYNNFSNSIFIGYRPV